jgi:hypothetical protein
LTNEAKKARAKENQEMNEKRMRKNRDGDTLGEKVKNYLEKLKKKDVSKLINDAFYELVNEQGVPF